MTSLTATGAPDIEKMSLVTAFKRILSMSWPIMLGALSMSALNLGQIGILGNLPNATSLYRMSLLQPYYLLFFAFLEALAITSQVFSARSQRAWKRGNIRIVCALLSLIGVVLVGLLAVLSSYAVPLLQAGWLAAGTAVAPLLVPYLVSLTPFLVFEILNGALRGEGRIMPGFLILAIAVAVNLALTYVLVLQQNRGLEGLFIANAVSGSAAAIAASITLVFSTKGAERGSMVQALLRMGTLLAVIGAPIFLSLVVSFVSSAILIDKFAGFGSQYAAGLVIVVRLRYFFLIPAIAMATSMTVLVNQQFEQANAVENSRSVLTNGFLAISAVNLVLIGVLFAARTPLIGLMATDAGVRDAAIAILGFLLPSFFMVGVVAAFQLILESLGRGGRVLFWTIILEAGTCAALLYEAHDVTSGVIVLLGMAVVYTVIFGLEYALLLRRGGKPAGDAARVPAAA